MSLRRRVYEVVEAGEGRAGRTFALVVMLLITINVAAVILETVEWIRRDHRALLDTIEAASVAVFTAELLLRVWSCAEHPRYRQPLRGRLRFLVQPMTIVDLVAIAPFYLPLVLPDLRFARAVRLLRLFRLMKFGRYSETVRTLGRVLVARREDLAVAGAAVVVVLVVSSCLMYHVEHDAQPQAFSSIPAAMWWGIATLTTVGYGDVYPVTPLGRFLGAVIALSGVGLVAMPAGILASGFTEEMQRRRQAEAEGGECTPRTGSICPHCGGALLATTEPLASSRVDG